MAQIDLSKYGITGVKEIIYNPPYDVLFKEEMQQGLTGYDKGQLTELGSKLQLLAVSLIDTVLPTLRQFIDWLQKGVDWLNGLDEGTAERAIQRTR